MKTELQVGSSIEMKAVLINDENVDELELKVFKNTIAVDPMTMKRIYTIRIETNKGVFGRMIDAIDYTPNFILTYSLDPINSNWCILYNDEEYITKVEAIEKFKTLDLSCIKKHYENVDKIKTF